jgi:hypothetical protein
VRRLGEPEVFLAEWAAAVEIVVDEVVDENEVHRYMQPSRR